MAEKIDNPDAGLRSLDHCPWLSDNDRERMLTVKQTRSDSRDGDTTFVKSYCLSSGMRRRT